jgi:hypothetical protein
LIAEEDGKMGEPLPNRLRQIFASEQEASRRQLMHK